MYVQLHSEISPLTDCFIAADYLRLAPPSVVFQGVERPGCCVRTVLYDITDDNIAEPDEILTLSIVRSLASNQIPVEYVVQSVNVTIVDNDGE